MRERDIEAYLRRRVIELGGVCLKLEGGNKGKTDRLVLIPGGKMVFVELKAPTGRLSAHQQRFKEMLLRLGFGWWICSNKQQVNNLMGYLLTK